MQTKKRGEPFTDEEIAKRVRARRNAKANLRYRLAGRLITKGLHGRMNVQNGSVPASALE